MDPVSLGGTLASALRSQATGAATAPVAESRPSGFLERLGEAFESADADQKSAEAQARKLAAGKGDVVETMIGLTRADLSLRFAVQMRNRALEAYQEIMRLPL